MGGEGRVDLIADEGADLGREVLGMPVRVATPSGVGGLTDGLLSPAYSTSIGLLCWAARVVTAHEPVRYESAPAGGSLGRIREWFRREREHLAAGTEVVVIARRDAVQLSFQEGGRLLSTLVARAADAA